MMTEFLSGKDVREMYFDAWDFYGGDCIAYGDTGVSEGGGVDNDAFILAGCLLDGGHDVTFVIRLVEDDLGL
jgi:hypothetical protein